MCLLCTHIEGRGNEHFFGKRVKIANTKRGGGGGGGVGWREEHVLDEEHRIAKKKRERSWKVQTPHR